MPSLVPIMQCALPLLWLITLAAAAPETSPKVIRFPIARSAQADSLLTKRDYVLSSLTNEEVQASAQLFYYLNITIGTPPQRMAVQIDTGSSDLWVLAPDADACQEITGVDGCNWGTFNPNISSTFQEIESGTFDISYADGTQILGDYVSDVVGFGGNVTVKHQTMGLAYSTSGDTYGLMGVGFDANEANTSYGGPTYPNIVDELKNQGHINAKAYSLWLDDLEASTGSILFGGVDRSKYSGELIGLPIQPDVYSENLTSFTVSLTSVSFTDSSATFPLHSDGMALPALLDSGTSFTYLPDDLAQSILGGVGVAFDNGTQANLAPCSLNQSDAHLTFGFGGPGGPLINVSLSEFVSDPYVLDDGSIYTVAGELICNFGIMAGGDNTSTILGDTFLRSAYVVYDLDNFQVALAQTNFKPGEPDIVEFKAGHSGIPGVTSTASAAVPTSLYLGAYQTSVPDPTVTHFPSGTFHLSTPAGPKATGAGATEDQTAANFAATARSSGPMQIFAVVVVLFAAWIV